MLDAGLLLSPCFAIKEWQFEGDHHDELLADLLAAASEKRQ
ncbi:MAG TPA: hypothetical protein VHQ90_13860 [Thermoanaerobaculia bacterium]|nr:hypothetical protein [Thermoanaerobaculia bacterium]